MTPFSVGIRFWCLLFTKFFVFEFFSRILYIILGLYFEIQFCFELKEGLKGLWIEKKSHHNKRFMSFLLFLSFVLNYIELDFSSKLLNHFFPFKTIFDLFSNVFEIRFLGIFFSQTIISNILLLAYIWIKFFSELLNFMDN